jgi:voltage-gated potassium channel
MAVKSLAPEVYTCAEVLDKKYLEHLQLGHCDEVVLSRQYSRSLLVGATMASGVTHVIHDLLDFGDRKGLFTEPVPGPFVGQTFGQLASHFKQEGQLLVGLLENTGQSLDIKREALREAQKTTNVATLVENLRRVKGLEPNRSVLAPPDDHRIGPHTLAVLIGQPKTAASAP